MSLNKLKKLVKMQTDKNRREFIHHRLKLSFLSPFLKARETDEEQKRGEKKWVDNPRERITSEREARVDGGRLRGVRDPVRPSALCAPTSLFSLSFSAFHRQTVTPTLPSPQQRARQPQKETPKPASRLQSACIWIQPRVPGQHRAPLLRSVLQRPPAWRSPVEDLPF